MAACLAVGAVACGDTVPRGGPSATPEVPLETPLTFVQPPVTSPLPATTASADSVVGAAMPQLLVLRFDGLGPFTFDTEMDVVTEWLTAMLGDPEDYLGTSLPPLPPPDLCGSGYGEVLWWPSGDLFVTSTRHRGWSGNEPICARSPVFVGWAVLHDEAQPPVRTRLTTLEGLGLGSTVGQLAAAVPDVAIGRWADVVVPNGFSFPAAQTDEFMSKGSLEWDWVRTLQRVLNARGADLTVDGWGSDELRTAFMEYQLSLGFSDIESTLANLGVSPPADAQIVSLDAGAWFWETECGDPGGLGPEC